MVVANSTFARKIIDKLKDMSGLNRVPPIISGVSVEVMSNGV
jgi:hypothetical protein